MGDEVAVGTTPAFLDAVQAARKTVLDESLEDDKTDDAVLARGRQRSSSAFAAARSSAASTTKDKFHAKAYITHASWRWSARQALVGSSNFTRPGLTQNIELNIQVQSGREVAQLQEWYEEHWDDAPGRNAEHPRRRRAPRPRVHAVRGLRQGAAGVLPRPRDRQRASGTRPQSKMFPSLDRYQQEAYWALMKIARQHGGAFLCDGVGLGKTFVGLMLIERLVVHERKRVVLFAPKAAKEAVWEPELTRVASPHRWRGGGATSATSRSSATPTSVAEATSRRASSAWPSSPTSSSSTRRTTSGTPGRAGDATTDDGVALPHASTTCSTVANGQVALPAHRHADQQLARPTSAT